MLIQKLEGIVPTAAPASAGTVVSKARTKADAQEVAPPVRPPPGPREVAQAVVQANRAMTAIGASVQFFVDPDTEITVVKIVDTENNEVLRQVPSQEMLDIARALDRLQGMLVRDQA